MKKKQILNQLEFNVRVLKMMNLWPEDNIENNWRSWAFIRYYIFMMSLCPSGLPITFDMIYQLTGNMEELIGITENLVALAAWAGMYYMSGCFMKNQHQMKNLVNFLKEFNKFGKRDFVNETEARVILYGKIFLTYGIVGNLCYASIPLIQKNDCEYWKNKLNSSNMICGLITRTRLPFDIDKYHLTNVMFCLQLYTCMVITMVVLSITLFLCAILIHLVSEIKNLKQMVVVVCEENISDDEMKKKLHFCIDYHTTIIEFAFLMREAFSSMMLVHMTLTSFVLSVLGFEILMVKTLADSIRFAMHLGGWIFIIGMTCYFGQKLHDESIDIAEKMYSTAWYSCKPKLRKDIRFIMMRAQRPLTLNAASMGHMSLEALLGVLSSAYSYFTLLINMKQ